MRLRECIIEGCDRPVYCRSACTTHYERYRRAGEVEKLPTKFRNTCSVEGCKRPHLAKGICGMHRRRLEEHGSLEPPSLRHSILDPEEAFNARTVRDGDCLIWTGSLTDSGYGLITAGGRVRAHRYAWERAGFEIPEGMFIDHICHVRSCVNVDHLRLATRSQNASNLSGPRSGTHSGLRGVTLHSCGKWMARCGGEYLGLYGTADEAAEVARRRRQEVYGDFAGKG